MVVNATDYACWITVSMSSTESSDSVAATVTIEEEEGGTYSLSLKNFYLGTLPVGTINLTGVEGTTDEKGVLTLTAQQDITISDGDEEGVTWTGSHFGTVGVGLNLTVEGSNLSGVLDIDVPSAGYTVTVTISPASDSDSGVTGVLSDATKTVKAYYNINGQQIKTPNYGQLYIIQYTDGTAVKRINK